jgi:hypothetical protein
MTTRRTLAISAAALLCGVGDVLLILSSEHFPDPGVWAIFGPLVGYSFVGTGLYAWHRRPESHFGFLMVLLRMCAGHAGCSVSSGGEDNGVSVPALWIASYAGSRRSTESETAPRVRLAPGEGCVALTPSWRLGWRLIAEILWTADSNS